MRYRSLRPTLIVLIGVGCALIATAVGTVEADEPRVAPVAGPLIDGFGATYGVEKPDFPLPKRHEWRLVFDVSQAPEDPAERNPRIETAARFLNMHARAGVPGKRMHLVLVIHGTAGAGLLQDAAYRARLGTGNPNGELLRELMRNGVRIVLCGQTAAHRDLRREVLEPGVEVALSAMTALAVLQDKGYALIAF